MLFASVGSFGFRLFTLLHIVAVVAAFAPAFVWPILNRQVRVAREAGGVDDPSAAPVLGGVMNPVVHGASVVLAGLFGFALLGLSKTHGIMVYKFSQTWVSIGMLLWFLMIAIVFVGLVPAQRALREAKAAADQRIAMLYGGLHLLLLLQLIDMIWKPGFHG